ncbi:MAG TPA: SRPBCC domain-containing protein [Gemmatimonadaceae bacterium]|nr:SRPBCC domain-containing protein [Gemmatimonadaceae bacterium]
MTSTMALPKSLPHRLERTVLIHATPETVFRFFTDSDRFAKWWGVGSTIEARPGGAVHIVHPGGAESPGQVLEVAPPRRLVFTYGFASGNPIPPGSSRVTITLEPDRVGTRLHVLHELADARARDEHVQGWRFQLSVFANVVADEVNTDAARTTDVWFDAWSEPDAAKREAMLTPIVSPAVRFQDRFSNLDGIGDLLPHLAAAQRFMPGLRMQRDGAPRHCQGMALVDWIVTGADGSERGRGTNAFVFGPTGRIDWVMGFWNA